MRWRDTADCIGSNQRTHEALISDDLAEARPASDQGPEGAKSSVEQGPDVLCVLSARLLPFCAACWIHVCRERHRSVLVINM